MSGGLLHHEVLGRVREEAVVLLHGFMGRGAGWRQVAARWRQRRLPPLVLVDLPGHGKSPIGEAPLSLESVGRRVEALVAHLGVRRAALVGYSMGGRVALSVAARRPGWLGALVLEGANPGLIDPDDRARRRDWDAEQARRLRQQGLGRFLAQWYDMDLFDSLRARPDLLAETLAARAANDPEALARVLVEVSPGRTRPLWGALETLEVPTLLVAGALDHKYVEITARAHDACPDASRLLIEGAGHNAHLERPEAFCAQVGGWLEGAVAVVRAAPGGTT